jgi:hypothetical protein
MALTMNATIPINNKTIGQIQEEFNNIFPYLRIQFFKESHNENEGSRPDLMVKNTTQLFSVSPTNQKLEILGSMKVSELENLFKHKYKLNIQVFRKSGNAWLETTVTDSWTLDKQNQEGIELSGL